MQTDRLSKKNLLSYAESIGGKDMYFKFRKALREAGVIEKPELNRKQIQNTLRKVVQSGGVALDRMKMEKLIDEHERRRQAYVRLAIDRDIQLEEKANPGLYSEVGTFGGTKRYEYKRSTNVPKNISISANTDASSSIFHMNQGSGLKKTPQAKAIGRGPVTSISKLNRPNRTK